ncbi:spore germination protein [Bacillus freudenreichii]|nr:spore germination protein [Bacillus freudenreichii]
MMKAADGKIGTREFFSLVFLSVGIKATDTTPNILFDLGGNAAWMMPIFSFFVIGVPFFLLLWLMKKHEKGLIELLFHLFGKYLGGFIGFILFLIIFSGMFIYGRSYIDIVNVMFYPQAPVLLLLFLLLVACSFLIAKRGLEAIGRAAWFIIPITFIILFLLVIAVLHEVNWMQIFPFAGPGFKQVVKGSITHSSIFGNIILFAALFPFVRSYKTFRLASFLGLGVSCVTITLFIAIYVMVFDYPEIINMAYPYQQLTRIASLGGITTHIESLFLGIWIHGAAIYFAITLYVSAYFFSGALRLDKFEPLLLPFVGLAFLLGIQQDNVFHVTQARNILIEYSSVILIVLPFCLWITDLWKGRLKK